MTGTAAKTKRQSAAPGQPRQHLRPPAAAGLALCHRQNLDRAKSPARQCRRQPRFLPASVEFGIHVLQGAAAASSEIPTGRLDTVWTGRDN